MRELHVFNQLTLDGYFTGYNGDLSWAHKEDEEWNAFVEGNASDDGPLLFGRITYEMMKSFWPTTMAMEIMPKVATQMNNMPKIVFSTTMNEAGWENTTIIKENMTDHVRRMKLGTGSDMTILGSGSIVAQLAQENLIDEYHLVINPTALGKGRNLFQGMNQSISLTLVNTRVFHNGNVLLRYKAGV